MAKKIDNSSLFRIGQQKAYEAYGMDAYSDDGRSKKQLQSVDFIGKHFPVKEVLETYFNSPYLYYVVALETTHVIKFKIDQNGYWQQFTVPVFGGVNTNYVHPVLPILNNQTKLL